MKNEMTENLKKRIKGDCYFNIILTALLGVFATYNVILCAEGFLSGNAKELLQNDIAGDAIRVTIIFVIFVLMDVILVDILRNGRPFTKKAVNCLRVVAVLTIFFVALPKASVVIGEFMEPAGCSELNFDFIKDGLVIMIGAVIGIISEVFRYGCDLEDEMNSIA